MLISACSPNSTASPAAARIAKLLFLVEQLDQHARDDAEIEERDGEAGDQPELLADRPRRCNRCAVRAGRTCACRRPVPCRTARRRSASASHSRPGNCRRCRTGTRRCAASRRRRRSKRGSTPITPATARPPGCAGYSPASASIATHTAQKMIVLPKSGCFISRKAMPADHDRRDRIDRQRLVAVLEAQQPGERDDEERLEELRRLRPGRGRTRSTAARRYAPGR